MTSTQSTQTSTLRFFFLASGVVLYTSRRVSPYPLASRRDLSIRISDKVFHDTFRAAKLNLVVAADVVGMAGGKAVVFRILLHEVGCLGYLCFI